MTRDRLIQSIQFTIYWRHETSNSPFAQWEKIIMTELPNYDQSLRSYFYLCSSIDSFSQRNWFVFVPTPIKMFDGEKNLVESWKGRSFGSGIGIARAVSRKWNEKKIQLILSFHRINSIKNSECGMVRKQRVWERRFICQRPVVDEKQVSNETKRFSSEMNHVFCRRSDAARIETFIGRCFSMKLSSISSW